MVHRIVRSRLFLPVARPGTAVLIAFAMVVLVSCDDSAKDNSTGGGGEAMVSVADASAYEGSMVAFVVLRTGSKTDSVGFNYITQNVTAGGDDYTMTSGSGTIYPKGSSTTIPIPTIENGMPEGTETFKFFIKNVTNSTVTDSVATGTILDNDE